jgi:hypothetical protein
MLTPRSSFELYLPEINTLSEAERNCIWNDPKQDSMTVFSLAPFSVNVGQKKVSGIYNGRSLY